MTTTSTDKTALQRRVDAFAADVIGRINQAIIDHNMTYEEYDAAKQWLIRVGQAGEWPLFLDVWVEHTCLLYTSPSPRDRSVSRMPSSA